MPKLGVRFPSPPSVTESENVAVVRRAWEAWLARDNEAALALYHPEVELDFTGGNQAAAIYGRYKGLDGVREFFRDWLATWENYSSEIEELIGAPVDFRQVHVWKVRDGKLLRLRVYATREEALGAVGRHE